MPPKILGVDSLMSFSGWQYLTGAVTTVPGEIKESYVTPLREDSGSLHLVSSRLHPDVPFPFADFALYPFAVTKAMSTTIC